MKYDFDEIIERRNTRAFKYDYRREYFGTEELIPMWVADMDFRTPDFVMEAIRKRAEHEILGYTLRPDSWYQAIIDWYGKRQNWKIETDWILFSPGIVAALSMAVKAFTGEGDKVVVQCPVYHPFFSVVKENRRQVVYNQLLEKNGRYFMDFEGLKNSIDDKVKLLLLSHPHNPVSRVWTGKELQQLADICLENGITIISDEIHSDLVFSPHKHIPLATLDPRISEITVSCVAPSKTFNLAGLASSAVIIENEKLREAFFHELSTGHFYMGNVFGAIAMETAYSKGHEWLDQLMVYLDGNRELIGSFLQYELPEISVSPVEATYLAWLDMRSMGLKKKELSRFMIEKAGIGCNDGPSFGPGGEGFQRLNFACPRSILEKALAQLKSAVRQGN